MNTNKVDTRRQSIYLPQEIADEILAEAKRLDRSMSWILQQSWKIAKEKFRNFPDLPVHGDSK